ncbi:MAG: YdiU family protein [Planctomycetes bacterium]|nr:YdiU family protein [Planctomycetota bacterium]
MPVVFPPNSRFRQLGDDFWQEVDTTPLANPTLIDLNPSGAALLGLQEDDLSPDRWRELLNGQLYFGDQTPLASCYGGHQFGYWAGRLGDGRAHILGERNGYECQLKGSGQTRYSRMGDGRAVLRSTLREYLISEYMHALGIPTTRSLGLVGSDEPVYRETVETGAMMIRLSPSFIRFGTFEYYDAPGKQERLARLLDFVLSEYYPECDGDHRVRDFFESVSRKTAALMAQWMAYGFCHGVMNTDNMSILGLTIDYGPYGFLEEYNPAYVCNHSDHEGRYSYENQPAVALWNLQRLATALHDHLSVEDVHAWLQSEFMTQYRGHLRELMHARFGLPNTEAAARTIEQAFEWMAHQVDHNRFLYALGQDGNLDPTLHVPHTLVERVTAWLVDYYRIRQEGDPLASQTLMQEKNPKYVLKNWIAQTAIDRCLNSDDSGFVAQLRRVLQAPFDEHPDMELYAQNTPEWGRHLVVSCSS